MKDKNKKDYKYFVYTGNSYPHKNLKRLVEAMVLVNQRYNVKLKISSSRGVFTERLESLIREKGAENYIELLGYVKDSDIKDLYKNSLAFVFPTLSEGFGLPPKEAIEFGTLAIVSNIPVLKEVYAESVLYFNPLDVKSIAKTMEQVLSMSTKERREKIKYAQKFLKRYSWQKMAKKTVKVYKSVV